jgi:hypothetical protein
MKKIINEIDDFIGKHPSFSLNKVLYPNQPGDFCLKGSLSENGNISEELKDALFVLSDGKDDIRKSLLMEGINIQVSSNVKIEEIYHKIDDHILTIFNDPNQKENPKYKKAVEYIINELLENEQSLKYHFPKML